MNAVSLYASTCRLLLKLQTSPDDVSWPDIIRFLPKLRNSLVCCVCTKLLHIPVGPRQSVCQHHVCKACVGGKMRLKPACGWCNDYTEFEENVSLRIVLQCYKKLCHYLASLPIAERLPADGINGTDKSNIINIIQEGTVITDNYSYSAAYPEVVMPKFNAPFRSPFTPPGVKRHRKRRRPKLILPETTSDKVTTPVDVEKPVEESPPAAELKEDPPAEEEVEAPQAEKDVDPVTSVIEAVVEQSLTILETPVPIPPLEVEPIEDGSLSVGLPEPRISATTSSPCDGKYPALESELKKVDTTYTVPILSTEVAVTMDTSRPISTHPLSEHDYMKETPSFYSVTMTNQAENKLTIRRKLGEGIANPGGKKRAKTDSEDKPKKTPRPRKERAQVKKKGCRCGTATPTPGKLTCCGQRCPCYTSHKACLDCSCRGCHNPRKGGIPDEPSPTEESEDIEITVDV